MLNSILGLSLFSLWSCTGYSTQPTVDNIMIRGAEFDSVALRGRLRIHLRNDVPSLNITISKAYRDLISVERQNGTVSIVLKRPVPSIASLVIDLNANSDSLKKVTLHQNATLRFYDFTAQNLEITAYKNAEILGYTENLSFSTINLHDTSHAEFIGNFTSSVINSYDNAIFDSPQLILKNETRLNLNDNSSLTLGAQGALIRLSAKDNSTLKLAGGYTFFTYLKDTNAKIENL